MRYVPLAVLILLFTSCTRVNVFPQDETGREPASSSGTAAAPSERSDDADTSPFKKWSEVLKDTRAVDGLIRMHLKRDQTLFVELAPDQLGKDFAMALQFSRGVGDFGVYDGLLLGSASLIRFERVGDQINLVHRNPRFLADDGSPMAASLSDNVGHSVIHVAKIESRHDTTKNVLINLTDFFASDYADLADGLKRYYGNKPISFDKSSSFVERIQGFPKNVEIDAALTYKASGAPPSGSAAVSDYRSLPIGVRYSFLELPEDPMRPRIADDRVGHFLTAMKDFSRDASPDPYVRYVNRWRLEKKNPDAELSEPVEPIVYYVDRSVPKEYRQYVREGIEGWNKAFEAAGFKNAVVARDAPEDDSTWSAEDIRYSTVRWSAAHRMGFAIGPSQVDPRTGEILNADILISSEFVRGWRDDYEQMGPDALVARYSGIGESFLALPPEGRDRVCMAATGKAHQLTLQHTVLAALGRIPAGAPMPEEYLGDAIRDLVMHEVGHTLGLRHNFKASSGIDYARLNDTSYTGEHGVSLSVMDYAPVNITADRQDQGHYWNEVVGTYDEWAIQYAYMPVEPEHDGAGTNGSGGSDFSPEAELPALEDIAEEASDPMHTYGTDEDNWLGAWAVDPLTNGWELGSDPLAFARDRAALVSDVVPELDRRLVKEGDRYHLLRGAMVSMLNERISSLLPVAKMIGGAYVARDHKGDPGARAPFTPVPVDDQAAALALIMDQVFAPDAFALDADILNKLAPNRYSHWGVSTGVPIDYPLLDYADAVHSIFIEELMHPARFQRMLNGELRSSSQRPYRISDMLSTMTDEIWSEIDTGAAPNAFRRNLQRRYTDQMIRLLLGTPPWRMATSGGVSEIPIPEHARSLSRLELMDIVERIDDALASDNPDRDTRAHLTESRVRIQRALDARVVTDSD